MTSKFSRWHWTLISAHCRSLTYIQSFGLNKIKPMWDNSRLLLKSALIFTFDFDTWFKVTKHFIYKMALSMESMSQIGPRGEYICSEKRFFFGVVWYDLDPWLKNFIQNHYKPFDQRHPCSKVWVIFDLGEII